MLRLSVTLLYFVITAVSSSCATVQGPVIAPNSEAKAINQISIQKNGCGPASLINAYRFGSPKWNAATNKIVGDTDKEQFDFIVRYYGRIFSSYSRASMRWDARSGINGLDLTDLANDFQSRRKIALPQLKHTTHFIKSKRGHKTLLTATHEHLTKSLRSGFPPLISIKRFAQRGTRWRQVHGHFVVLYEIPGSLPLNATAFEIKYIDPWGGKIKTGTIKIPEKAFFATNNAEKKPTFRKSPTLTVDFPQSSLGRNLVKKNERSATILAASITP
ncbi:MAG: hypothetical protein ACI9E1_000596 [Cryomorphaceae bacterium]|jgi:hypothetical protein